MLEVARCSQGLGKVNNTFQSPAGSEYVSVATSCVSQKNDKGGGGPNATYLIRADGKLDRVVVLRGLTCTMEPPAGVKYVGASCQDTSAYLLRSDGAIDRTTGGGKVSNTMNPPPGERYTDLSAGQWASYFLVSNGKIDRTTGGGKVGSTLSPDAEPTEKVPSACSVM